MCVCGKNGNKSGSRIWNTGYIFKYIICRVRYAYSNAIGQMSTDFAPVSEKKFHARVLPGLLLLMDDAANPRVQAHAGAALVNFSEGRPKNIMVPYLPDIMAKKFSLM